MPRITIRWTRGAIARLSTSLFFFKLSLARARVNSAVGCLLNMILYILLLLLLVPPQQAPANPISDAQKKQFIELLKTLPHKGEFFTDDAVKTAGPYLPVLFALTDKDIEGYDIYPFAAISRGLCDVKEHLRTVVDHLSFCYGRRCAR